MCHMLLSDIERQKKDRKRMSVLKTCGECKDFTQDTMDFWNIGTCARRGVTVSIYHICKFNEVP